MSQTQEKAYEPDDGTVNLNFEEEAAEVTIEEPEVELAEDQATEVDLSPETSEEAPSEQEEYGSSVQKRIDRLTKKMREAERQKEEAIRYAQNVAKEAEETKQKLHRLDQGYMEEYGGRIGAEQQQAEEALRQSKEYEAAMFREYKAGKLDPEPGEVSRGRLQKLQEKLEEMEMTGDKRLMTPDEMEELMFLEKKFAKEALDAKAQGTRKMSDEEIAELKALSDMGYKDGGLVNLTAIKIPDNNQSGVESLFKRR